MVTVLLIFHLLIVLSMIGIILIQRSEAGALGISGGAGGGLMTARGTANLLTRATAILAALFFISTLILAGVFRSDKGQKSIVDEEESLELIDNLPALEEKASDGSANHTSPEKEASDLPANENTEKKN